MPDASLQKIANTLNAEGHTTKEGKQFYPMQVKTILDRRSIYEGCYRYSVSNLKGNIRRFYHDIGEYPTTNEYPMIQTSYFSKAARLPNAVAISQGIPDWYNGARYKPLAPSWDMIHLEDHALYKER